MHASNTVSCWFAARDLARVAVLWWDKLCDTVVVMRKLEQCVCARVCLQVDLKKKRKSETKDGSKQKHQAVNYKSCAVADSRVLCVLLRRHLVRCVLAGLWGAGLPLFECVALDSDVHVLCVNFCTSRLHKDELTGLTLRVSSDRLRDVYSSGGVSVMTVHPCKCYLSVLTVIYCFCHCWVHNGNRIYDPGGPSGGRIMKWFGFECRLQQTCFYYFFVPKCPEILDKLLLHLQGYSVILCYF